MRTKNPVNTLAIGLVAAWLSACSGGSGSGGGAPPPPPPPPAATVISGQVVDAAVTGATVTAYTVSASGQIGSCIQVQGACATATTDASGNYSLNLGSYSGPVLLQSSGGSYTDTVTGQMVTIPAGQTLSVFLPSVAPGSSTISAQLTVMTTLAAQFALQAMSQGVGAATAASNADTTVQTYFGLAESVVTTGLLDLTQANCGTAASDQAQLDASLILAGFAQLASQFNVQPIALGEAIAEDATSNGGQLTGTIGGATPITVPEVSGGGTVPLATIEGSSFGQTLETAIKAFEASVRNACNASQSSNQTSTLGSDTQSMGGQQPPTYIYTVNGTVSGFTGTSTVQVRFEVVLNCSADTLTALAATATVNGNGAFSASVKGSTNPYVPLDYTNSCNQNTWTLSVPTSPGQTCGIAPTTNGTFTASNSGNTNVATPTPTVTCAALPPQLYSVGGQVTGLAAGKSVTVTDSDNGAVLTLNSNGAFTIDAQLASGTAYNVTANNSCTVTNGSGTVEGANIANIAVSCAPVVSVPIASPQALVYLPGSPAYLFLANPGSASGGQVLVYSEQTNGATFTGLTLVASITAGISHPTRLALDDSNHLYVTNASTNTVTVYDVSDAANIAANTIPQLTAATMGPANITNPLGITVDRSGNVYVASNGVAGGWVSVFVPCGSSSCTAGSFVFSTTLTNDGGGHQFAAPGVMADYHGSGATGSDFILLGLGPSAPQTNMVLLYSAPLTATSAPLYVLSNIQCATGPSGPTGIALTASAAQPEIYIASFYNSSVAGYGFDNFVSNPQACPVPDFSSSATSAIAQPEGLAVDESGNIFVTNTSASTIAVYSPGAGLAAAPVYTQH